MVLDINSLQLQNKIFFIKKFSNSLIFKLTAYLVVFTIILIFSALIGSSYFDKGSLKETGFIYLHTIVPSSVTSKNSPPVLEHINVLPFDKRWALEYIGEKKSKGATDIFLLKI